MKTYMRYDFNFEIHVHAMFYISLHICLEKRLEGKRLQNMNNSFVCVMEIQGVFVCVGLFMIFCISQVWLNE